MMAVQILISSGEQHTKTRMTSVCLIPTTGQSPWNFPLSHRLTDVISMVPRHSYLIALFWQQKSPKRSCNDLNSPCLFTKQEQNQLNKCGANSQFFIDHLLISVFLHSQSFIVASLHLEIMVCFTNFQYLFITTNIYSQNKILKGTYCASLLL